MNKNKRSFKKVLAAICAFSGTFGGDNSGASAALKNRIKPMVETVVNKKSSEKSFGLNRKCENKNFFGKTWDLIKANPIKSILITAGSLAVAVGMPLIITKLVKGKKDDKGPSKPGGKSDIKSKKKNEENEDKGQNQEGEEEESVGQNQEGEEEESVGQNQEGEEESVGQNQGGKEEEQREMEKLKKGLKSKGPLDNINFEFDGKLFRTLKLSDNEVEKINKKLKTIKKYVKNFDDENIKIFKNPNSELYAVITLKDNIKQSCNFIKEYEKYAIVQINYNFKKQSYAMQETKGPGFKFKKENINEPVEFKVEEIRNVVI